MRLDGGRMQFADELQSLGEQLAAKNENLKELHGILDVRTAHMLTE